MRLREIATITRAGNKPSFSQFTLCSTTNLSLVPGTRFRSPYLLTGTLLYVPPGHTSRWGVVDQKKKPPGRNNFECDVGRVGAERFFFLSRTLRTLFFFFANATVAGVVTVPACRRLGTCALLVRDTVHTAWPVGETRNSKIEPKKKSMATEVSSSLLRYPTQCHAATTTGRDCCSIVCYRLCEQDGSVCFCQFRRTDLEARHAAWPAYSVSVLYDG